ncbi:GpE family phage tail protein [Escherichia coli]|nr:GpE family phage tail protein [Escherichia coli]
MKKNTRFAFNAYLQQLARLNGVAVEELSSKFTVEPSVQQTLTEVLEWRYKAIQRSGANDE